MKLVWAIALGTVLAAVGGLGVWQLTANHGVAQEAAGFGSAKDVADLPQVWVEAIFVQIDTADLKDVKAHVENTLDAQTGDVILTGTEKEELLTALRDQPSCEILGAASVVTLSGQSAVMQLVEEVRYPTEYQADRPESGDDSTARAGTGVVVPGMFETRHAGVTLDVSPLVSADGNSISLVLLPEVSFPTGWIHFTSDKRFSHPVVTSWNVTTTLTLRDGQTVVLTGVPTKNFEESALLNPQVAQRPKGGKSSLFLISVKIVYPGEED
jgi:type II secretory pathway component GspD/PulD (secretin)